jgi:hypothetical protein
MAETSDTQTAANAKIDAETFVRSVMSILWMANELPRKYRKDMGQQMMMIKLLISDPKCCYFNYNLVNPLCCTTLEFNDDQRKAICKELEKCNPCHSAYPGFAYPGMLLRRKKKKKSGEKSKKKKKDDACFRFPVLGV